MQREQHAQKLFRMHVQGQDDGSVLMPVEEYLASRHQDKPLGVYCVYNQEGALQYIGYARNMVLSIKVRVQLRPSTQKFMAAMFTTCMLSL